MSFSLSVPPSLSLPLSLSLSPSLCLLSGPALPQQRASGDAAGLQPPAPVFPAHIAAGLRGDRRPPPSCPSIVSTGKRPSLGFLGQCLGGACGAETDVAMMQQSGHRGELSSSSRTFFFHSLSAGALLHAERVRCVRVL